MKLKELGEKTLEMMKKLNRKAVIAAGAVVIIGVAVLLNFLLLPDDAVENQKKIDPAIDLSDVAGAVADADEDAENASNEDADEDAEDAFAQMTLDRQQARDEAMEVLNAVAESDTAVDAMKEEAMNEIQQIAKDIECEANIESLIKAKGFEECVAVVSGDSAQVIVKTDGLMENEVAQISEIVYEQANIVPDNLKIIESN